jgi:hypothetical protein
MANAGAAVGLIRLVTSLAEGRWVVLSEILTVLVEKSKSGVTRRNLCWQQL